MCGQGFVILNTFIYAFNIEETPCSEEMTPGDSQCEQASEAAGSFPARRRNRRASSDGDLCRPWSVEEEVSRAASDLAIASRGSGRAATEPTPAVRSSGQAAEDRADLCVRAGSADLRVPVRPPCQLAAALFDHANEKVHLYSPAEMASLVNSLSLLVQTPEEDELVGRIVTKFSDYALLLV